MREILLFIFLFSLIACPYPGSSELAFEAKRKEIEKKLDTEIRECILKKSVSNEFKEIIRQNTDKLLINLVYINRKKLSKDDRKIYRNCRKGCHKNYMKRYQGKMKKAFKKGYRPPEPNANHEPIE